MSKTWRWLLPLWMLSALASAQTVIDDSGNSVKISQPAMHIADAWFAHHSLLMTLGAGDRIVATVNHPADHPWMFKVQPSLQQALQVKGKTFASEALVVRHVDAIFVPANDPDAESYRLAGIPVLAMNFDDFSSMKRSLATTAQVVGTPEAAARAQAYNRYLDEHIAAISEKTAALSDAQRPRVLHIQSLHPLKIDGRNTLIDTWIQLAGGRNVAAGIDGNMKPISPEEVIRWNPDVIIIGAGAGSLADSEYQTLFASVKAVQQHRVWQNPAGVFPWDRYGTEVALQIQWAAKQLHPTLFTQLDLVSATQAFYRQFYDFELTAEDAQRILQAQPPQ
ncbi:ABC transporter substrate-binding protein [Pantoea rodasii]|uniref:ABC transporter substrate-binding protein n=1 Tax=Pantoea rodasii TaxID=1076549 RepID=A0A2M9W740_9GAMM|nr:ABC transporter substrate-binding protein [Pantoea rodasii]ORM65429.1 ABC transporter substrate-binding protein [Pantoea rodasii]PJZ03328.1 ABC transporter substrate-binding protein [Pantoea rodasii]